MLILFRRFLTTLFVVLCGTSAGNTNPVINTPAPPFVGLTSKETSVALSDFSGKYVVLEWTNNECPYVKKHYQSGNMQQIQRQLTDDSVVWISVISSANGMQGHVSGSEADKIASLNGSYADMIILDEDGTIGRLYNAKTTPELFLIDPEGFVRYMGAIDDKPSARPQSLENAHNYLIAAWNAVKEDKTIPDAVTKPYGCSVKYAE
ncbi:redoxin domain-containing protein [Kordiimonas pumila]|uniref:Redoxin domain-containing protein n=1 Tax=Kordiimonas pumila TaxID=2161677 RepID=A0ABV7D267_9PROT|nr:redoxin domain-containing protein [Kordiimonas pumila]